jgi:hypothetical protein
LSDGIARGKKEVFRDVGFEIDEFEQHEKQNGGERQEQPVHISREELYRFLRRFIAHDQPSDAASSPPASIAEG